MRRQYEESRDRQTVPATPAVLDEIEQRRRAVEEEEQRRNAELEAARSAVAADEAALQDRIDQLLSSSPEEFVIRFIQTEGE
jgi:ribosomal protein L9